MISKVASVPIQLFHDVQKVCTDAEGRPAESTDVSDGQV